MNKKKVALFLMLTFGIDWTVEITYLASGGTLDAPVFTPIAVMMMLTPALVAIFVQKIIFKDPIMSPLGIRFKPNRWFIVAWILPPMLAVIQVALQFLLPSVAMKADWHELTQKAFLSVTRATALTSIFAFGEELGWRGFLWNELAEWRFWKRSSVIEIIWGVWHAPLILAGYNYPQHAGVGMLLFTIVCVLLGNVLAYLRVKSQSVLACSLCHGAFNSIAATLSIIHIRGGSDILTAQCGVTGIVSLLIANIAIFFSLRAQTKTEILR